MECRKICVLEMKYELTMYPNWLPQDSAVMQFHDEGSKFEDECDSAFDPTEFAVIKEVFGAKHTINQLAMGTNRRGNLVFNSLCFCKGITGTPDAF